MDVFELLKEFVAIQSVSTDPTRHSECDKAAEFLKKQLAAMEFEVKILEQPDARKCVFGRKMIDPNAETICIYGHYDVQPEDPVEEWTTPPFEVTEVDGAYYGRGISDNKGHVIQNIATLHKLIENNDLKKNVLVLFEGEEEVGSGHIEGYLEEIREDLEKVDVFYITDTGMYAKNVPQIYYGLRGLVYFEVEIVTGNNDLHSGIYGNKVHNPALIAAQVVAAMKDSKTHKVLIPGFYDEVKPLSDVEKSMLTEHMKDENAEKNEAGVFELISLDDLPPFLSTKVMPSLDVNGIFSGYTGAGAKTVIPYKATVKFSCRLVEHQDPKKIEAAVKQFIDNQLPEGTTHTVKTYSCDAPFYMEYDNEVVEKTRKVLSEVFGNETKLNRTGGTIPIAEAIQRIFNKPIILTGFVLPDCNMHAPQENYDKDMFWKGIDAFAAIYRAK